MADVVIAKFDGDAHRDFGEKFGIKGFPTLKFFKKGSTKAEDYTGAREAEDLYAFVTKKTGIKVTPKKIVAAVKVLDSSNFHSTIQVPTLVEFYARNLISYSSLVWSLQDTGSNL